MKCPRAGKPTLSGKIIKMKKTCIATTRIFTVRWPPHLPYGAHSWKNVFWQKTLILLLIAVHAQDSCACTWFLCMHKILVHAQDSCACTRIFCMHKILVHARDSRACTRILGMHKILAHAQDSCACTRFLCMHKNLVHAQESCACARILCMPKILVHARESRACTRILCMQKILVHAQESCACTRILCMHKNHVHAQESCACTAIKSKINVFCQNTFFHEWAPYGRWGGHRTVKIRVVAMHVFFIFMIFPDKVGFPARGHFMTFQLFYRFWTKHVFSKNDPEVSGSARGASPTY